MHCVSACVVDIASYKLKLNTSKIDLLWCATYRRQHQLPSSVTRIGSDDITPSTSVRGLGILLDGDLFSEQLLAMLGASPFCASQLRSVVLSVPLTVYETLIV